METQQNNTIVSTLSPKRYLIINELQIGPWLRPDNTNTYNPANTYNTSFHFPECGPHYGNGHHERNEVAHCLADFHAKKSETVRQDDDQRDEK